jgi:hypothetical protein
MVIATGTSAPQPLAARVQLWVKANGASFGPAPFPIGRVIEEFGNGRYWE